ADLWTKKMIVHNLAGKALDSGSGSETFAHGHEVRGLAVRAHLSCWAFWSGSSVIHIQGTISQHAAIQSFDCFLRLSVVCHFHECKPARQPSVTIHNDMNLHPPVRRLRTAAEAPRASPQDPGFPQRGFSRRFSYR